MGHPWFAFCGMLLPMHPSRLFPLRSRTLCVCVVMASAAFCAAGVAQDAPATPAVHIETPQELLAKLTPPQRKLFVDATHAINAQHFADALATYKDLLKELPGDPVLIHYAGETALDSGDDAAALALLKPAAQASPDDAQTAALLTRACAESGDAACRDAGIAHMLDLHKRGLTPPGMTEYIVEHIADNGHNIVIWAALDPLGKSQSYDFAQVSDNKGNIVLQITLESSQKDQARVAQLHAYEASKGIRGFSLHSYAQSAPDKSGNRTQTTSDYSTFTGEPTYAVIREQFIKIANGKGTLMGTPTKTLMAATPKQ